MKKNKNILIRYVYKYRFQYIIGIIMLMGVDYLNLYFPQLTGEIIDGLTTYTLGVNGVLKILGMMVVIMVALAFGRITYRYFVFGTSRKIETEIRNELFEKIETLSPNFYNHHKTGDLMTHFTNDLEATRNAIGNAVISTFDAIVETVMVLFKMIVYIDLRLTIISFIPLIIIALGGYKVMNFMDRKFTEKQEAFGSLSDMVQESITGERVIKAFVQETKQDMAFKKVNTNTFTKNMAVAKMIATVFPLMDLVIGLSLGVAIAYGGYLALIGDITIGRLIAFTSYINILVWPMIAFGDAISSFSQGRAAIGRIQHVFDEVPEIVDEDVDDIQVLEGNITLNNVTFKYQPELDPALENISIQIQKGETLAVLGRTGAGKSTLISLLLRLYNTTEGNVAFDGKDIHSIPLKTLRESIAYVPQDSYLFSDTLENNIAFGKRNATHEEVVEVCKDACVHDNIIDFPEGYETVVGERGVTLSGGQKQRCAIARAFLKDAPILILDDSLSAVDTDTEDQILENLKQKRVDKTTIMIAHRISTVKNADHILVLEEGKKAEYGTFEELMALGGIFKEMYDKQQLEKQLNSEK